MSVLFAQKRKESINIVYADDHIKDYKGISVSDSIVLFPLHPRVDRDSICNEIDVGKSIFKPSFTKIKTVMGVVVGGNEWCGFVVFKKTRKLMLVYKEQCPASVRSAVLYGKDESDGWIMCKFTLERQLASMSRSCLHVSHLVVQI